MSAAETGRVLDANPDNTAISTYWGNVFDIMNPDTWLFDPMDIAYALPNICRFAGHVEFYSVGEHSLRVRSWLRDHGYGPEVQLAGLLHDASEVYLLDIPRPWKSKVYIGGKTYYEVEDQINERLMSQFGVLETWKTAHEAIKEADIAVYQEESDSRPTPSVMAGVTPRAMTNIFIWTLEALQAEIAEQSKLGVSH